MIEFIFTIDYEIYGNGEGSLKELVYEPAEKLRTLFKKKNARLVFFVEAAELDVIANEGTDKAIDLVKKQICTLHQEGFEVGLHLHTQWYNGRYKNETWQLDYNEYNICNLPETRIVEIVSRSITYLRSVLGIGSFTPLSFRAGNWLFQPTYMIAKVLTEQGIRIDSSVFKGGLQHKHKLDYRRSLMNGYYWRFTDDVNIPDSRGIMLELPIYTQMVPCWKMITLKRVGLKQNSSLSLQRGAGRLQHISDFLRLSYPMKLDFCRMTIDELTGMVDTIIREDQQDPASLKPVVAIGHTKDLIDFETIELFLSYLMDKNIPITTFAEIYPKCY
jgi:hypothetical protein